MKGAARWRTLTFRHTAKTPLRAARKPSAITGVVASGNLEVLVERVLPRHDCEVAIATPSPASARSGRPSWRISSSGARPAACASRINDGGARPDTVSLRLLQGARLMEA